MSACASAGRITYHHTQALRRILDARQLGLKYIANVTYGYTSATYSGRMPAVEIADSIVQSGRETLEKVCLELVSSACSSLQRLRIVGHSCDQLDQEVGREGRLWGHRFLVHLSPRQDQGTSLQDRPRHGGLHHEDEPCSGQTQVREGVSMNNRRPVKNSRLT